jgi:hypothetical protein
MAEGAAIKELLEEQEFLSLLIFLPESTKYFQQPVRGGAAVKEKNTRCSL